MHVYKDLLELAGSSGAGRVISKLVTFADGAVLTVFFAYCRMKQKHTCNSSCLFIVPGTV